jgi:hypothetical protein
MTGPRVMCRTARPRTGRSTQKQSCRARACRNDERVTTGKADVLDGSAFYRRHTENLLRRYVRMSMQIGRVPSCLPREYLPTRSGARQGANFEDGVIFVHDMERCLGKLDRFSGELVSRIGIQEYSRREVAEMLGMSHGQLARNYDEAIDRLTGILLLHQIIREGGNESQRQAYS